MEKKFLTFVYEGLAGYLARLARYPVFTLTSGTDTVLKKTRNPDPAHL